MPDAPAITLKDVTKTYKLYASLADQIADVLGLAWLRFWRRLQYSEYPALASVSMDVKRGERIGIVGRNGAGKTTLLKLLTGNFQPTAGTVEVHGRVQALLNIGLGFHPEFTGLENVRSSLAYSGLSGTELERVIQDVVDFAELDEYLHQPFKTYSLGMQARLMFAASTAINPDILIIDEILGAGDAYFSAKSAHRMEKLATTGCTLLLVSHSMQQVLQFCQRAIWLEAGKVVMDGEPLAVVKAYEEYSQRLEAEAARRTASGSSVLANEQLRQRLLEQVFKTGSADAPDEAAASIGGVSRWTGEGGLRIEAVRVVDAAGNTAALIRSGSPARIELCVAAERKDRFPCIFVVVLFTRDGRVLSRHCSDQAHLDLKQGESCLVSLTYNPVALGNGHYFFSAAAYRHLDLNNLSSSKPYDLLSRSFEFSVTDEYSDDPSLFHHPARWDV